MSGFNLNRKLVLEAAQRVQDGAGGYAETWQPVGVLWGALRSRSGRLARGATGSHSVTAVRITVRAAPTGASNRPQAGQRFAMGSRLFRIEAVNEDPDNAMYLHCSCEEETAA
ncbi:head-tail adaptor protein [Thalassococcus lentus]|uniref:Head-tail adaptor protein n=1 Tax=Thalassococcus lentus TaxID=1210524 RepID=A0ABT4XRT8_9RHOB|nr:head-tail adaptor protein [Thalassococcus lentus]MDA7424671.1 head-tail adaptor protein [Thalassococcus lentus]